MRSSSPGFFSQQAGAPQLPQPAPLTTTGAAGGGGGGTGSAPASTADDMIRNAAFTREILQCEGLTCVSKVSTPLIRIDGQEWSA